MIVSPHSGSSGPPYHGRQSVFSGRPNIGWRLAGLFSARIVRYCATLSGTVTRTRYGDDQWCYKGPIKINHNYRKKQCPPRPRSDACPWVYSRGVAVQGRLARRPAGPVIPKGKLQHGSRAPTLASRAQPDPGAPTQANADQRRPTRPNACLGGVPWRAPACLGVVRLVITHPSQQVRSQGTLIHLNR